MAEQNLDLQENSMQEGSLSKSPGQLRTDVSHSTAQNTVARP